MDEALDFRRLILYFRKRIWIVLLMAVIGGAIGALGYQVIRSINMPVEYQATSKLYIRFNVDEVPLKKKSAVGVRGMKLTGTDEIEEVFFIANGENPVTTIKNKKYELNKVKLTKRDSKGTKVRG